MGRDETKANGTIDKEGCTHTQNNKGGVLQHFLMLNKCTTIKCEKQNRMVV